MTLHEKLRLFHCEEIVQVHVEHSTKRINLWQDGLWTAAEKMTEDVVRSIRCRSQQTAAPPCLLNKRLENELDFPQAWWWPASTKTKYSTPRFWLETFPTVWQSLDLPALSSPQGTRYIQAHHFSQIERAFKGQINHLMNSKPGKKIKKSSPGPSRTWVHLYFPQEKGEP
jgi:hypothetical protein